MRILTGAFIMLATTAAMAFPAVGDMAVYDGVFTTTDGNKVEFEMTQELIRYDSANDSFTMRITSVAGQTSDTQEAEILRSQLTDGERVKKIVHMCELINGGQTVVVPAGTFPLCSNELMQPNEPNLYYFGDVPFGLVMSAENTDSGRITKVLKSFRHGN